MFLRSSRNNCCSHARVVRITAPDAFGAIGGLLLVGFAVAPVVPVTLSLAGTDVAVAAATADAGQDDQLKPALDAITRQLGVPQALVYNAGLIRHDRPGRVPISFVKNVLTCLNKVGT